MGAIVLAGAQNWSTSVFLFYALITLATTCAFASNGGTTLLVSFSGEVSVRNSSLTNWQKAEVGQVLPPGLTLKTQAVSHANILFPDGTQIKLAEDSELIIKAPKPLAKKAVSSTDLLLARGKLWGRAKSLPNQLSISTPTATASIRGTEWEVDATKENSSSVMVLSGQVELSNSIGSVVLGKNMRGTANPGAKPNATQINNARDRVQWISNYRPLPSLYLNPYFSDNFDSQYSEPDCELLLQETIGTVDPDLQGIVGLCAIDAMLVGKVKLVADLIASSNFSDSLLGLQMQADLSTLTGNYKAATQILETAMNRFGLVSGLNAQRAAIDLHFGNLNGVRQYLEGSDYEQVDTPLGHLVAGDYFFLEGDFSNSEKSYRKALENVSTKIEALIRLAKLNRSYGNSLRSESLLREALQLEPKNYLARAQNAELQLENAEYENAIKTFEQLLSEKPDDLLTLNALAEAYLAEKRPQDALKSIRKAGLVEPSSAMPNVTAGLIQHQNGNIQRSYDELLDATEKDPKDPMPMFLLSAISADEYRIGDAMHYSRAALERIPYLKSLDKVSTDRSGSSNIGNAYSKFGLEDFAKLYALDSYQPNWAGSQFFLAEREQNNFARSSLSLRGFINEPTTFGALKRRISLIDSANVSTEIIHDRSGKMEFSSDDVRLAVSGLVFSPMPISFFVQKTKGRANDDGYGKEFSNTVSSVTSAYSEFVTGSVVSDARMGSAWDREVSIAEKDINTFGIGFKPISRLNLFALHVRSKESSPSSRIYADSSEIIAPSAFLKSETNAIPLSISDALSIFPVIDERTQGRYVNKLFVSGFKYQITDSLTLLGKHTRSKNRADIKYQTTTICPLSTVTNQSVGVSLQNQLLPIAQEILFLNQFYSPGNRNSLPKSFWSLYEKAQLRGFRSECPLAALSDDNYQTDLTGYDVTSNSLRDYSLFIEKTGPNFDFSFGYEISKGRDITFWGTTGSDPNQYLEPVQSVVSQFESLPGIDFFCGVSPVQSPLCQTITVGNNPLFSKILSSQEFSEQIEFYGQDLYESEYVSTHVRYKMNDKAIINIALQGVANQADFFKRYKNSAVEYLYGGFSMYFPGADLSDIDGDTVSIQAPQESLNDPNGSGWKFGTSASILLKPNDRLYVNLAHTDQVKPNLNVTLAPVYLGFTPSLQYGVSADTRVSTNHVSSRFVFNDKVLLRMSLSESRIRPEKISDNSGWGGSYVTPSTKGYTEWLTSNVFDQMRSNELRGLGTTVGPYENQLCMNCRQNTKLEFAGNFIVSPNLSANLMYMHHQESDVVPMGASTFLSGALECLSSAVSEQKCEREGSDLFKAKAFPKHYFRSGVTWVPVANLELSLLVEHATRAETLSYRVNSVTDGTNLSLESVEKPDWTDAHAMLRWQSADKKFRIEASFNGIFSEKYPSTFLIRSSLNL